MNKRSKKTSSSSEHRKTEIARARIIVGWSQDERARIETASKTRARQAKPVVICSSRNIRTPPWKEAPAVLTRIRAWKCLGNEKWEEDEPYTYCSLARCRRKGERKGWVRTVGNGGARVVFLVKHSRFPPHSSSQSPQFRSLHFALLLSSVSRAECSGSWSQLKRVDMLPWARWFEESLRRGDERGIHRRGEGATRRGETGRNGKRERRAPR